jgi:anaerobic magnesium-protoporphyrin IX monomethyl ester cyclase
MKCKAVLMNPPTVEPTSEILLNLAYLSSTLKQAGHKVLVLDATAPHNPLSENEIKRRILQFKPHFIGVTLTINYIPQTYDYLKRLKQMKIPIVAGGPHTNCLPEEVLQHGVDIVAIGEGEDTILELAEYFIGKKEIKDIAGICFRNKDGTFHYTAKRPLIENLDRITFPDYDSFPIAYYTGSSNPESNPIFWSVFSSRGCPYNCIFCSSHNVFGRTYRARSPQNVFNEIEFLAEKYGARKFAFQDDEAFINKERVIEFCNLVKNSRFPLKFSARLRIDNCDEEMFLAMKSIGFKRLSSGIESFNDETLRKINKKYNVATIFEGFKILKKVSFAAIGFNNIVGFPWEKPEHIQSCINEISKIPEGLIYFSFTCTPIPYPGTKLYEQYHEQYGFTNWWLDPKRNSPHSSKIDAFFILFLPEQIPLYTEDIFWKYSPEMKQAINDFCWKSSSMYLKRCLRTHEYIFIYGFSKLSHMLWKRLPRLEKILFYPLVHLAKWFRLDRKTMYIHRY